MSADPEISFDALRDAILRGVAHAVSNRVAALGGIAGVVDPGQIWTEKMSHLLHGEAKRLDDILRLLRLIPTDDRAQPGAIEVQALIPDVVSLHALNSALLQVECVVEYNRETMPVLGVRPQLVHTLLLIIDTAKRQAQRSAGRVVIRYRDDGERVSIRVATEPSGSNGISAAPATESSMNIDAIELALRSGIARVGGDPVLAATVEGRQLCIELTVPTLAAGRRSERAVAGSPPAA